MKMMLSILYVPVVYFVLWYYGISLEDVLYLKVFPLILSLGMTFVIWISYIKKKSMILYFAKKFSKSEISKKEKEYIHHSTLFWILISCINVVVHTIIFLDTNENSWIFYSSIGWYFLFLFAGVLQYLHRKLIFLKELDV